MTTYIFNICFTISFTITLNESPIEVMAFLTANMSLCVEILQNLRFYITLMTPRKKKKKKRKRKK